MEKKYALLALDEEYKNDVVIQQIEQIVKDNNGELYTFLNDQNTEKAFTIIDLKKLGYTIINIM